MIDTGRFDRAIARFDFLESYLDDFVARHGDDDEAKFTDILTKSAKKMAACGCAAALTMIALPSALEPVVRKAMVDAPINQ